MLGGHISGRDDVRDAQRLVVGNAVEHFDGHGIGGTNAQIISLSVVSYLSRFSTEATANYWRIRGQATGYDR